MTLTLPRSRTTVLAEFGPNWFACVMGTGIVANAAVGLPVVGPALRGPAVVVWMLAATVLVAVTTGTVLHWRLFPETARGHVHSPVMAHFYGAPAMALMTVGTGALTVAAPVIGTPAAVAVDVVLWTAGTLLGLWTAAMITVEAFTTYEYAPDAAFGGWLMPVVPPMVSAATLPVLLPHLPGGQVRQTMIVAGYAMFGLALLASVFVIAQIWARLVRHKVGPAATVPTLWIVLGPLGQSVTASHTLGAAAPAAFAAPYGSALESLAVVYGVPTLGFALLWLAIAAVVTRRTARAGLPFTLSWWSFTFPVGTMVTGTSGLAAVTGLVALQALAIALFGLLLVAWAVVGLRTLSGVV